MEVTGLAGPNEGKDTTMFVITTSQYVTDFSPYVTLLDDPTTDVVASVGHNVTAAMDLKESTSDTPTAVSVLLLFQFVIGWIGIVGNLLVLVVFISSRSNVRNQTNLLITHQAFVDLLASTMLVFFSGYLIIGSPMGDHPFLKAFGCYVWNRITLFALFVVSTFNLTLISVERYVATMWPIKYQRFFGRRNLICLMCVIWIFGPICQYFVALTTRSYKDGICVRSRSPAWVGILLFLWEYLLPVLIMTFSFSCIIRKLRLLERKVFNADTESLEVTSTVANANLSGTNQGNLSTSEILGSQQVSVISATSFLHGDGTVQQARPLPSQTANRKIGGQNIRRRNATQSVILVYIMYVVCWSPNQWAFFQLNLGGTLDFGGFFYQMSVVLAIFNTCVNPFIYAFRHRIYKGKLLEMYRAIRRCCLN